MSFLLLPAPEVVDSVMLQGVDVVSSVKMPGDGNSGVCSMTAISGAELDARHVCSVKELSATVPNFYQPDYGSRMTSSIYVRGFGSRIDQPVVGMNIDDVPVMNKNCYDYELFDIDRVQVVRGAQSALYGRNTSGGAINLYTLSPFTFQGKRLSLEYGNGNSLRVKASHYSRHSGKFGWSASAFYSHSDGFFENKELGVNCDGGDNLAARLRVQYMPVGNMSIDNTFAVGYTDEGGWAYRAYDAASGKLAPVAYNDPSTYRRFVVSDGLVVKCFLDWATLSSATGFQYLEDRMRIDNDFLSLDYFSMGQYQRERSLNQEFVIKSHLSGVFNFTGGISAFYKNLDLSAPVRFKQYGIDNLILKNANEYYYHLLGPDRELSFRDDNFTLHDDFDIPAYGAAAYFLTELSLGNFDFQAGLRLDYERSVMDYDCRSQIHYKTYRSMSDYTQLNTFFTGRNETDALELLPSFSVSYRRGWGNVYLSARKGFKAGGFNTQLFSDILQNRMTGELVGNVTDTDASATVYKPEENWTYELGAHVSPLPDGSLNISATIFYIDCRNQQLTVFPKGMSTGRMMSNAGKSFSCGAELAANYSAGPFTVGASYGYTHAEFREYVSGDSDYSGNILPFAPRETVSANVAYRLPVPQSFADSFTLNAGWNGVGRIYWNEENSLTQAFYGLLSASVDWRKGAFGASLWGKNLLNEQYNTFYFRSIGNDFFAQGKPLQFGISLNVNL